MLRPLNLTLLGCLLVAGCGGIGEQPLFEQRLLAMGTWVDLTIDAPEADGERLAGEIGQFLRGFERDYYAWADDGALARLNRALADGGRLEVDADLARVLEAAKRYCELSEGAFEPAVGDLVELWGFESDPSQRHEAPPPAAIEAWLRRKPSIRQLTIDGAAVDGHGAALKLDLGGIAKGEAVDRIVERLAAAGVANALVNAGGDLRVLGSRRGKPWRVGIKAPRGDGLIGIVELEPGESAFTSGDYERYFEVEHRRLHHILDPTTGYPVDHTQAVTVIAGNGLLADAAATAVLAAGPERWRAVARALGVELVLRVDASGGIEATPAMRERLQMGASGDSAILASGPESGSLAWQAPAQKRASQTD